MVRAASAKGFTLLELLVVLTIISVILAIARPLLPDIGGATRTRGVARELASALSLTRSKAIAANRTSVFAFDLGAGRYRMPGGKAVALPDDLEMAFDVSRRDQPSDRILFFPDGSSTGGTVTLTGKSRVVAVRVDWLTGRVSIDDKEILSR